MPIADTSALGDDISYILLHENPNRIGYGVAEPFENDFMRHFAQR